MNQHPFQLKPLLLAMTLALSLGGCSFFDDDDDQLNCPSGERPNAAGTACEADLLLHVPSPEWRDQVIYFAMIDRFADGDSSNNDQGAGEFDPTKNSHYSGGDIPGMTARIDYIKALGATAVWITPPVANLWWNPRDQFSGYHGYWARDFKSVDEHYGTLNDYKAFSDRLHRNGMYLIQDVVPNHVGNFFEYVGGYNADDTAQGFTLIDGIAPTGAPTQFPFNQNDRNNPDHAAANIYHWTPTISDYKDQYQEFYYQTLGLDDLNTGNPVVRTALKDSFGYWIKEVGVDAFRVDTAKFVEHEFWNDFIHSADGVLATAATTGRTNFLTFGEVFEASDPYKTNGEEKAASFIGSDDHPQLGTVISFPLQFTATQVFAEGQPTAILSHRLEAARTIYPDWTLTPTFIDNHDTARFLAAGTVDGLKQAFTLLLTAPGIPIIYQGDEQAHLESRRAMFAGGYASNGQDAFDTDSEMFRFIQQMVELRKERIELRRGGLELLADSVAAPGVFAYRRHHEGAQSWVVMNTSGAPVLLNQLPTGLTAGQQLQVLSAVNDEGDWLVGPQGLITRELPPRSAVVLAAGGAAGVAPTPVAVAITNLSSDTLIEGDLLVTGTVDLAGAEVQLVIDGDLAQALTTTADNSGAWQVTVPAARFGLGESRHQIAAWHPTSTGSTPTLVLNADIEADSVSVTVSDELDDDYGPTGNYRIPQDSSFNKQMDLVEGTATAANQQLTLTLTMQQLTTSWNPANGFDHVGFSIFIDLPGQQGLTVLPQLNASMPDDANWDLAHIAYGWGNLVYNTVGADASTRGSNINGAPLITTDAAAGTITFTYDGNALGVSSWQGAQIYVTTWDIDGLAAAYRDLSPEGGDYVFGGGNADDPKVLDDMALLQLPVNHVVVSDASGDEAYLYPQDASFGRQMDLLGADARLAEDILTLTLPMSEVTTSWNPANGFDHVSFSLFFDHPELTGINALPLLNANLPDGQDWDRAAVVFGWGNSAYSSTGADANTKGSNINGAPLVSADAEAGTVTLTFDRAALGLPDWRGVRINILTWDIDGMSGDYRPLSPQGADYGFGGGAETDPKVMDEVVLQLP